MCGQVKRVEVCREGCVGQDSAEEVGCVVDVDSRLSVTGFDRWRGIGSYS